MTQRYYCQHCHAMLGELVEGEAAPHCPDHPDGPVALTEADDGDPQHQ